MMVITTSAASRYVIITVSAQRFQTLWVTIDPMRKYDVDMMAKKKKKNNRRM